MSITVKKIALSQQQPPPEGEGALLVNDNYLSIIASMEIECQVRLGSLTLTIEEFRQLKQGQILPLAQKTHEPIDVLVNNQVIARGELMSAGDCFAILITEISS